MRFSAAIQPTAPQRPVPVQLPAPVHEANPLQQAPTTPFQACDVPPDLDQRVRLTGEW